MAAKVCIKCGEEKDLELFYRAKKNKDGRQGSCKACNSEYQKKFRYLRHQHYQRTKEQRNADYRKGGKYYRVKKRRSKKRATLPEYKYGQIKAGSTHRQIDFTLTYEEYLPLHESLCYYCNEETVGGLDRVDNSIGYEIENVVPCCSFCNYAKRTYSRKEFLSKIEAIYNHSISKNNGI